MGEEEKKTLVFPQTIFVDLFFEILKLIKKNWWKHFYEITEADGKNTNTGNPAYHSAVVKKKIFLLKENV